MNVTLHNELLVKLARTQPEQRWFLPRRTRWVLIESLRLTIGYYNSDGVYVVEDFEIPEGFEFDAASIPFFLWWRFQPTYHPSFVASCFHDYCYEVLYEFYTKDFADSAFKAIMIDQGAPTHVAYAFYWSVSIFGKGGW